MVIRESGRGVGKMQLFREQIGLMIATARKEKKWSQQDLADKTKFTRVYINNIEKGNANFTADALGKITNVLGLSVSLRGTAVNN